MGSGRSKPEDSTDSSEYAPSSVHIIVVGAGLVGLALASSLSKKKFQVTVLEQDEVLKELGAGINLPVNSCRVLQEVGALAAVREVAVPPPKVHLHDYLTGEVVDETRFNPYFEEEYGFPYLTIHRADLRKILYDAAEREGATILMGTKVLWQQSDVPNGILVSEDGRRFEADLIVAADGEHSQARIVLNGGQPLGPRYATIVVDRLLIKMQTMREAGLDHLLDPPNIHIWLGSGSMVVTYQLKGVFNIALCRPTTSDDIRIQKLVSREEIAEFCKDWEPVLRRLIDISGNFLEWSLSEPEKRFESWIHPSHRLIMIGDASDTYLPYLAQGAAMGFESAVSLSQLLSKATSKSEIPSLLDLWERTRRPRMQRVFDGTKQTGVFWMMRDGPDKVKRNELYASGKDDPKPGHPNLLRDPEFAPWLFKFDPVKDADEVWEKWRIEREGEPAEVKGMEAGEGKANAGVETVEVNGAVH